MERPYLFQVLRQGLLQPLRQGNDTVLLALAVPDDDLVILEIHILNPRPNALHQPHAGAVEQGGHQMRNAIELFQQAGDLAAAQHHREPSRPRGPREVSERVQGLTEYLLVQKDQGIQRLILGAGRDLAANGKVLEKCDNAIRAHLRRIAPAAEQDEATHPRLISAAERRLALIERIPSLAATDNALILSEKLIAEKAIPAGSEDDALHIAIAATQGVDYLLIEVSSNSKGNRGRTTNM